MRGCRFLLLPKIVERHRSGTKIPVNTPFTGAFCALFWNKATGTGKSEKAPEKGVCFHFGALLVLLSVAAFDKPFRKKVLETVKDETNADQNRFMDSITILGELIEHS